MANPLINSKGKLNVEILGRGFTWLDTGTHDSVLQASNFIQSMEFNKGEKISCLEEIAFNQKFITKEEILKNIEPYADKNEYYAYIKRIVTGNRFGE